MPVFSFERLFCRIVPKNLHLKKMNPNIDLTDFPAAQSRRECRDHLSQVIMPSSIIDWKVSRAVAGTSSFGFSGTNSHGTLEAPKNGSGRDVPLERAEKLKWNRTMHRMYHEWSQGYWFSAEWRPCPLAASGEAGRCLLVGAGALADGLMEMLGDAKVVQAAEAVEALEDSFKCVVWPTSAS